MNDPDTPPADQNLAALLAAADKDAPPADPGFLAGLREQSLATFEAAGNPATPAPTSPRKRTMLPFSFRWAAAGVAALVLIGFGVAYWAGLMRQPAQPDAPPEDKFVVEPKLTDDGRIGKVTDAQGVVSVKPVLHERWSPVQPRLVLKPGDWLRTDSRGANAVALQAAESDRASSSARTRRSNWSRRTRFGCSRAKSRSPRPTPPSSNCTARTSRSCRSRASSTSASRRTSSFASRRSRCGSQGFKGTTANESIGSLVATVDGRNVPLTVGYHHVTVDIRDQIARTTIEESFVNTHARRARRRVPLPAAAGRVDLRVRHVDRRPTRRGRRRREAARPRNLRDDPAREARPGAARMGRRQHLQGPRLPDPGAVREADQDHLHAGAAAARQPLPLQLRACKASCSSSTRCAT